MNQNPLNEINQTQQIKIELHKNIQILRESLRQVKNLRSTVDQVFKYLIQGYNDDFQNPDSNKQHQKFLHSLQTRYLLGFTLKQILRVVSSAGNILETIKCCRTPININISV